MTDRIGAVVVESIENPLVGIGRIVDEDELGGEMKTSQRMQNGSKA
jgi:hypothetical protein